jgi:transposase
VLYPENLSETVCIDEVALSDGELYTVVTNGKARGKKGALIAMVEGTRSEEVGAILEKIPLDKLLMVKEVTLDLAQNMHKLARNCFPNAPIVADRFHVLQLVLDALQEMRLVYRRAAIDNENQKVSQARDQGKVYHPEILSNGDTEKQLLARSRYLLYKAPNKWSASQRERANLLFSKYPDLRKAYELCMMFRNIYESAHSIEMATTQLEFWYEKVEKFQFEPFLTAANSVNVHKESILAFFRNRSTNAMAENFNAKIKAFRSVFRGVKDIGFFIYRLTLLTA